MTTIKVGKYNVDVANFNCNSELECFQLGFDKGTFVQGRGYVKYHKKEKPVCQTRHIHGCPRVGVCLDCRSVISPSTALAGICSWCRGTNIQLDEKDATSNDTIK